MGHTCIYESSLIWFNPALELILSLWFQLDETFSLVFNFKNFIKFVLLIGWQIKIISKIVRKWLKIGSKVIRKSKKLNLENEPSSDAEGQSSEPSHKTEIVKSCFYILKHTRSNLLPIIKIYLTHSWRSKKNKNLTLDP